MLDGTKKIIETHQKVMKMMDWDETQTWTWMGTPMEELDFNSPSSLIIDGKSEILDGFLTGVRMAMEKKK